MNICLLNDSFPPIIDGVANVVLNYGRALTNNHQANVVVATPKYPDADYTGYPYKWCRIEALIHLKLWQATERGSHFLFEKSMRFQILDLT